MRVKVWSAVINWAVNHKLILKQRLYQLREPGSHIKEQNKLSHLDSTTKELIPVNKSETHNSSARNHKTALLIYVSMFTNPDSQG